MKMIVMGNYPKAFHNEDGRGTPKVRGDLESWKIINEFNEKQGPGRLRAEMVEIAYSQEKFAIAVFETDTGRLWEYL